MIIYLDNDGVLANLIKGIAQLFGLNYESLLASWPLGEDKIEKVLGISRSAFYSKLDGAGEDFWENLELYPHAMELYEYCQSIAPTFILTKATLDPGCLSGKVKWFHKVFGRGFQKYIITAHKEHCAQKNRILVDDLESNIEKFTNNGGYGIIFPLVSNKRHSLRDKGFEIIKEELKFARYV